jgi:hypothetical protein
MPLAINANATFYEKLVAPSFIEGEMLLDFKKMIA